MRLAVVVRSGQFEKEVVTAAAPVWHLDATGTSNVDFDLTGLAATGTAIRYKTGAVHRPGAKPHLGATELNRRLPWSFPHRARQRGAVLIVALLVLVATILAAIALVRSVDVATLISGNLAFRQAGVQAADSGVEVARTFLMARPIDDLGNNIPPAYFATWDGGVTTTIKVFDPKTFDWTASSSPLGPTDAAGNKVDYVVHRMCQNIGDPGLADYELLHRARRSGRRHFEPDQGAGRLALLQSRHGREHVRRRQSLLSHHGQGHRATRHRDLCPSRNLLKWRQSCEPAT